MFSGTKATLYPIVDIISPDSTEPQMSHSLCAFRKTDFMFFFTTLRRSCTTEQNMFRLSWNIVEEVPTQTFWPHSYSQKRDGTTQAFYSENSHCAIGASQADTRYCDRVCCSPLMFHLFVEAEGGGWELPVQLSVKSMWTQIGRKGLHEYHVYIFISSFNSWAKWKRSNEKWKSLRGKYLLW